MDFLIRSIKKKKKWTKRLVMRIFYAEKIMQTKWKESVKEEKET